MYGTSPDEVQALLDEEIARYRRGDRPAGPFKHETVQSFLKRWIDEGCRAGTRQKTNYRTSIARIDKAFGDLRLDRVTPHTIDAYVTHQIEKRIGDRALLMDWQTLHAAFACALRWELITRNPVSKTQRPTYEAGERQALDVERARKLITRVLCDDLCALWLFALGTGMRPSEVSRIGRDRVDLIARAVSVPRRGTKTRSGVRTIPLPPFVVEALREHQKRLLASGLAASTYLFPRGLAQKRKSKNRLEPMDRSIVAGCWSHLRDRVGDDMPAGFAFKDLRHTYSSLLKKAGAHPLDHKYLMGHSEYDLTDRVYTHDIDDSKRAVADALQALLFPPSLSESGNGDA